MPPKKKNGQKKAPAAPPPLSSSVEDAVSAPFNPRSIATLQAQVADLEALLPPIAEEEEKGEEAGTRVADEAALKKRIEEANELISRCQAAIALDATMENEEKEKSDNADANGPQKIRNNSEDEDEDGDDNEESSPATVNFYFGSKPPEACTAEGFPRAGFKVGYIRFRYTDEFGTTTKTTTTTTTVDAAREAISESRGIGGEDAQSSQQQEQQHQGQQERDYYEQGHGYFHKLLDPKGWYKVELALPSPHVVVIGPLEEVEALYRKRVPDFLEAPFGPNDYAGYPKTVGFPLLLTTKAVVEKEGFPPAAEVMPTDPEAVTVVPPSSRGDKWCPKISKIWKDLPELRRIHPRVLFKPSHKWIREIHLVNLPKLESIGSEFAIDNQFISICELKNLPNLRWIGDSFLRGSGLKYDRFQGMGKLELALSDLPKLQRIGKHFCSGAHLKSVVLQNLPSLTRIAESFCSEWIFMEKLELVNLPELTALGDDFCARTTINHMKFESLPKLACIGKLYLYCDHGAVGDLTYRDLPLALLKLLLAAHYEDWKSAPSTYIELDNSGGSGGVVGKWKMPRIPGEENPESASGCDEEEDDAAPAQEVGQATTPLAVTAGKRNRDAEDEEEA